ncbi:MAG: pyridoxal phosphate-dependent aminotransferase, partial [Chthoniobacterales bacterium]
TLLRQNEIDRFMGALPENIVVAFDEAYFEYVDDPPNTLQYIRERTNVVVLRTFSKIHGLASLRVGYGIAHPELIQVLQKTRQPFNVGGLAQAAALGGLADEEHQRTTKRITHEGRAYLQNEFTAMNLKFVPSAGNFVLVNIGNGAAVFKQLLQHRIIVRALKGYNLPEWVRISVGTMEQNRQCIAALKKVLKS